MAQHKGVDAASNKLTVSALRAARVEFVSRYGTSAGGFKFALTRSEAERYTAGGIRTVSNWEQDGNPSNTVSTGEAHAHAALSHFTACGMPKGGRIYFSIDRDVAVGSKDNYFRGIKNVLGQQASDAYGSAGVLAHLRAAGLIRAGTSGWRTMSIGWTGGASTAHDEVIQTGGGHVGGVPVDWNTALVDDYGGWFVGGVTPVQTPPSGGTHFPLPAGDWYGVNDGTKHSHSGFINVDRINIRHIQGVVGASADGSFGSSTRNHVESFQHAHGLLMDGKVGPHTWAVIEHK